MLSGSRWAAAVSVVIPCYNSATYLREVIASAVNQTTRPAEIIVIDDGSSDDSAEVAAAFGDLVRVFRQPNSGANGARNLGIRQSRGAFVATLDADDLWPLDSLAIRLRALDERADAGFAYGEIEHFFSPELPEDRRSCFDLPPVIAGRLSGSILFRRSTLDRVGPFDAALKIGEMVDWMARAQRIGIIGVEARGRVLRRRVHANNMVLNRERFRSQTLRALRAAVLIKRSAEAC